MTATTANTARTADRDGIESVAHDLAALLGSDVAFSTWDGNVTLSHGQVKALLAKAGR